MNISLGIALLAGSVVVLGCTSAPGAATGSATAPVPARTVAPGVDGAAVSAPATVEAPVGDQRGPRLRVRVVKGNLDVPWDLTFLPSGAMLYTQRARRTIRYRGPGGGDHQVRFRRAGMWASGETGLMSILAARDFRRTRHFYTCHGANSPRPSGHDVRVVLWKLRESTRSAARVRPIVRNLPATSGRHGGCRLRYGPEGALYIGTGDAAVARNPQNLRSGGGKVLRVRPRTGHAWKGNPFIHARKPMKRRVFTYGHRNVQGLAVRPGGRMWSVEHGSYRDDEVNRLRRGGNYGWDPDRPGYDESVPMTDFSLPGKQIGARWRSGNPTIATSGAVWLRGPKWGVWQGTLAVAALKDSSLRIMKFRPGGAFVRMWTPRRLDDDFGRLRSPVLGPGGNLYITTANGGGNDRILRVVPRRR